ncbi:MAG TPA: TetR/AcrR family transcriptional regulator [Polyangiaceae bacterium]
MRKGEATRQVILDHAATLASEVGLEGLTIGSLAEALKLSKSGLFAHFRSKEALQMQVLEHVAARFVERVVKPALRAPRGEARLRALFENLLEWPKTKDFPGGCPIIAATSELDSRPGPARDLLVAQQKDWLDTIASVVRAGVAEGQFCAGVDAEQVAYELYGIEFAYHHARSLLEDPSAERRARVAFEALVERAKQP